MIHEEIVTFEIAKLAKGKGFPLRKVIKQDGRAFFYELPQSHPDWANCDAWYLPTQNLLQRWLREEKGIHIGIGTDGGNDWCYITVVIATGHTEYNTNIFPTYEQALEDGLKYALEKLV